MKIEEGSAGGASYILKAKNTAEDPRATGGLVSVPNFPHPQVAKQNNTHSRPFTM